MPGTLPPAKEPSRSRGRDNVLHPFDGTDDVLEKRGAPPRYSAVMWPLLIGLVLAAIAPKLFDVFSGFNPWIERLVFPYVLLAARPEFGLDWKISGDFPRLVLLLQFPLEGLLTMINLRRRVNTSLAIGQLIFIHLIGAFVLFLLVVPQTR